MEIIRVNLDSMGLINVKPNVSCIGYFDGVHLGHQKLIETCNIKAKETGLKSGLITFDPDPWTIVNGKDNVFHITPLDKKINVLEQFNLDYLFILEFSKEMSQLAPEIFMDTILDKLNVKEIVCGSDFKFGYRGQGRVNDLIKHGYGVEIVEVGENKIGTTSISQNIIKGDVDKVYNQLGRHYSIKGVVVDGNKQGRLIGFPTANIEVSDEYFIPKGGVYAGLTLVNGKSYRSIVNIGFNPTFNTSSSLKIESYILDFNEDIYGQTIEQVFIERLRDELKFDSIDALIEQMNNDKERAVIILKAYE